MRQRKTLNSHRPSAGVHHRFEKPVLQTGAAQANRTAALDKAFKESVATHGVLEPIIVVRDEDTGRYQLSAGERRWKAATAAVLESIATGVKKDQKVQIIGFGTFEVKKRAARMGRNPKTGEQMKIKASKTVGFKCSSNLKASPASYNNKGKVPATSLNVPLRVGESNKIGGPNACASSSSSGFSSRSTRI